MERTLGVLNDLVRDKVIEKYAIGGAVGAIFWVEPFDTIDLDVFVLLPPTVHPLDPLRDVITYVTGRGYGFDGEFLSIEGVPVQFLPADDSTGLRRAALDKAVEHRYLGAVPTWVISAEYLIALALDTHRSKDYERVFKLMSETTVDRALVASLIAGHGLQPYWDVFLRRYPEFA